MEERLVRNDEKTFSIRLDFLDKLAGLCFTNETRFC